MPASPPDSRRTIIEDRRARVAAATLAGGTVRGIRDALARQGIHVSTGTVSNDQQVCKRRWKEQANVDWDLMVGQENAKLDLLESTYIPKAVDGDTESGRLLVRVFERRAKLNGLDAPVRHELTGPDGGPVEVSVEERAHALAEQAEEFLRAKAEGDAAEAAAAAG